MDASMLVFCQKQANQPTLTSKQSVMNLTSEHVCMLIGSKANTYNYFNAKKCCEQA